MLGALVSPFNCHDNKCRQEIVLDSNVADLPFGAMVLVILSRTGEFMLAALQNRLQSGESVSCFRLFVIVNTLEISSGDC